jgi:Fe2+ or Zn2+ uptake regulation protein
MVSQGGGEQLRVQLLTILQDADRPMTTSELRDHLHAHCASRVVIETVYRNLTVLLHRDEVERRPGAGRDACWGPTEATQRSLRNRPA